MSAETQKESDGTLIYSLPKGFDGFSENEISEYNKSVLDVLAENETNPEMIEDTLEFGLILGDIKEHHVLFCIKTQTAILMDKVRGVWIARILKPCATLTSEKMVMN